MDGLRRSTCPALRLPAGIGPGRRIRIRPIGCSTSEDRRRPAVSPLAAHSPAVLGARSAGSGHPGGGGHRRPEDTKGQEIERRSRTLVWPWQPRSIGISCRYCRKGSLGNRQIRDLFTPGGLHGGRVWPVSVSGGATGIGRMPLQVRVRSRVGSGCLPWAKGDHRFESSTTDRMSSRANPLLLVFDG